jgi:hypothetical protein
VHHKYEKSFEAALAVAKEDALEKERAQYRADCALYDARLAFVAHRSRGHGYHDRVSNWRD